MCYAIIKIDYRSKTEQSQMVQVEKEEDVANKLDEIKMRPEVRKLTVFYKHHSHELVTQWRVQIYEEGNKGDDASMLQDAAAAIPRNRPPEEGWS